MKLFEIFNTQNAMKDSADFFQRSDDIERQFNQEAFDAASELKQWYADNDMDSDSFVPIKRIAEKDESEPYSNIPLDSEECSAGYRGLQTVKQRAGHNKDEYDPNVAHENPLAEPLLTDDLAQLIQDAHKRLNH